MLYADVFLGRQKLKASDGWLSSYEFLNVQNETMARCLQCGCGLFSSVVKPLVDLISFVIGITLIFL